MARLGSENPLFQKVIGANGMFGVGEGELGEKNGKKSFGVTNRALFYFRMTLTIGFGANLTKNMTLIVFCPLLNKGILVLWSGVVSLIICLDH
jgi:hypothetical protein